MTITIEEARALSKNSTLYSSVWKNRDGSPSRARVIGKVKLWKRDPLRRNNFDISCKHGLRNFFNIYSCGDGVDAQLGNTEGWWVSEEKALAARNDDKLSRE